MNSNKKSGQIVGALFLTVMVAWTIGYVLIEPIITAPDFLETIFPNRIQLKIGVLVEFIEVIAVIGIAVMMFPIFKKQNERWALGYLSFRILESITLIAIALAPLFLITLSQGYLESEAQNATTYQTLGTLVRSVRAEGTSLTIAILYGFGALIFYALMYRSKLLPRFISVWGLIGVPLMLIDEVIFEIVGQYSVKIYGLPILGLHLGLIEIFLGIWLLAKGFNIPKFDSAATKREY